MSKAKIIMGAGILLAGCLYTNSEKELKELSASVPSSTITAAHQVKRKACKVYHRFEEIPEITDKEAHLYNKNEYTYIINGELYQKTGEIELKRVLKDEVTKASALSLIYRSECGDYYPKKNEDQIVHYKVDMKIINPKGTFTGPSQMNDVAITLFMRYLAVNPKTRPYVLPLLQYTPQKNMPKDITTALNELEALYYDDKGNIKPMSERNSIVQEKLFHAIKLNNNAWQKIASPKLKTFINKESHKRAKGLSNTTKNYLCLTELFPSTKDMQIALEEFNLSSFSLGRSGKPKDIMLALALSMNLKDENGNLDATRIPTYAISASISHVNWKGNGKKALTDAKELHQYFKISYDEGLKHLKQTTKLWVTGKSRKYGVNELSKLNIITPTLIHQYRLLELAGSKSLLTRYNELVKIEESKINSPNILELAHYSKKQK